MLSWRDVVRTLRQLDLPHAPVIVHTSLRTIGPLRGGGEALLAALLTYSRGVLVPTFTYKTMVTPRVGPPLNGIDYAQNQSRNRLARIHHPDMPPDRLMGVLPRLLLRHRRALRTHHPILSFAGVGVEEALCAQTLYDPLAPIGVLARQNGWVLLIGVDHTSNTSLHYAEKLAGRRQFVRWALTPHGVRALPGFPGCSLGFQAIAPYLYDLERTLPLGNGWITALPLAPMLARTTHLLRRRPRALLCEREDCLRCQAIRQMPRAAPTPLLNR